MNKSIFTRFALIVFALTLILSVSSASAQFRLTPRITLSEEYNDNIYLDPSDFVVSDWLTTVEPGFRMLWETRNLDIDLDYSLHFVYFKDNSYLNETSFSDVQRGQVTATLFPDEKFTIVTEGEISRVVIDESDRTADENEFINRATLYDFSINPSYTLPFSSTFSSTLGYLYEQSTYSQIDNSLDPFFDEPNDFRQHIVNLEFVKQFGAKTSLWTGYFFTDYQTDVNNPEDINEDFLRHDIIIGIEQQIGSKLSVLARGGMSFFDFDESGSDSGHTWQVDLSYQTTERLSFEAHYAYNYEPSISRGLSKIEDMTGLIRYQSRFTADLQIFHRKTTFTEGEIDIRDDFTEDKSTGATLNLTYPLGRHFEISLNTDYAYWEFKPDNEEVDRYGIGPSLTYNFNHLDITLSHTYRVNSSNDDENDYRNNITLLELTYEM